jgi:hypothetical protein
VRHRRTKGPATDMPSLSTPRHISTLLFVFGWAISLSSG